MATTYDKFGNEVTDAEDSGNTSTGDGGFDWNMVFSNAGGILTGVGSVWNAINGKPNVTVANPYAGQPYKANTTAINPMIWIIIAIIVVLLFAFLLMRKK